VDEGSSNVELEEFRGISFDDWMELMMKVCCTRPPVRHRLTAAA
jgi:hypothetical protein